MSSVTWAGSGTYSMQRPSKKESCTVMMILWFCPISSSTTSSKSKTFIFCAFSRTKDCTQSETSLVTTFLCSKRSKPSWDNNCKSTSHFHKLKKYRFATAAPTFITLQLSINFTCMFSVWLWEREGQMLNGVIYCQLSLKTWNWLEITIRESGSTVLRNRLFSLKVRPTDKCVMVYFGRDGCKKCELPLKCDN